MKEAIMLPASENMFILINEDANVSTLVCNDIDANQVVICELKAIDGSLSYAGGVEDIQKLDVNPAELLAGLAQMYSVMQNYLVYGVEKDDNVQKEDKMDEAVEVAAEMESQYKEMDDGVYQEDAPETQPELNEAPELQETV